MIAETIWDWQGGKMNRTYRSADFWVGRVFLDQRLINSSLLFDIARGQGLINVVELVNVEEGIPSVLLSEVAEIRLDVGCVPRENLDTRGHGFGLDAGVAFTKSKSKAHLESLHVLPLQKDMVVLTQLEKRQQQNGL